MCSGGRRENGRGETNAEEFMEKGGGFAWFCYGGDSDLKIGSGACGRGVGNG